MFVGVCVCVSVCPFLLLTLALSSSFGCKAREGCESCIFLSTMQQATMLFSARRTCLLVACCAVLVVLGEENLSVLDEVRVSPGGAGISARSCDRVCCLLCLIFVVLGLS